MPVFDKTFEFESDGGGCDGWLVGSATAIQESVVPAHSGAHSCRLCLTQNAAGFMHKFFPAMPAGVYELDAFVRSGAPDAGGGWRLDVSLVPPDGGGTDQT